MSDAAAKARRSKTGVVVSDKMQKTIVVRVGKRYRHAEYGKVMDQFKKFKAHDEKNEAKVGDVVEIQESRPISKHKTWRLVNILQQASSQVSEEKTS